MPFKYKPLDSRKNEIRLIKILSPVLPPDGATATALVEPEPVKCLLQHVSLDDYTTAYADFLKDNRLAKLSNARALLWDHITVGDSQLVRLCSASKNSSVRLLQPDFDILDQNPKYQNKRKYNADCSRWKWGDFYALSYVWGQSNLMRKIIVNGQPVDVTPNLENALRSIGSWMRKHKWQYIWIDALCINQKDIIERNIEIRRLENIFAEAHTVLAWMGSETEESESTFNFINKLARMSMTSPSKALKHVEAVRTRRYVYEDSTWKGLLNLVYCKYWARLWIIQEVGLANMRAALLWGDQECLLHLWLIVAGILMQDLYDILYQKAMTMVDGLVQLEQRKFQLALLIEMSRSKLGGGSLSDLMALLQRGRLAEVFDARDKIYGLLGLMDPAIREVVIPDYHATELEIYRNFSRAVIKVTGSLDIICQVRSNTLDHQNYPSWVVDWSLPPKDLSGWKLSSSIFHASGDLRHDYQVDGDETRLICRGFKFDVIDGLGCDLCPHTEPPHRPIVSSTLTNPYGDEGGIRNAIWATLTLGQMNKLAPSVATNLRSIPWLGKTGTHHSALSSLYQRFGSFQRCNRAFEIAGEDLEYYFPKLPKKYDIWKDSLDSASERALQFILTMTDNKRLMKTKGGYVGLVPKHSQQGDLICVFHGCGAPVVLKPHGDAYKLVGESYVHGIMNGEAMAKLHFGKAKLETIVLC